MASEKLANLQEEVTCPICLELLTEPLTLDCGHSFCQICLTANSKESMAGQEEERKCPVCRISYESGKLRPNWHLANIVQRVREVKLSLEDQEKHLCVHHGEKLLLFCEEDGKVICWLCERSQKHRGHSTFLIEEVAQDYQKKLQAALERLKQEQQEAEALESDFREEIAAWKNQTQRERQNVETEFKKLRAILDSEERKELQKLKAEQTAILCTMANSENELVQQSQLVRSLISDIEHRLQGSTVQMLQDVSDILKRSKTLTLEKPKPVPKEQRSVFRAPDLRDILRVFNELRHVQRYWVHVTLSHTTGNRNIAISADRRQVTYVYKGQGQNPCWKEVYEDYGVLGSPVITSGRHYWEVDVSKKCAWILGVYGEKHAEYNTKLPLKADGNHQNVYPRYQPKNGYWVIGLNHDSVYNAFDESSSSDPMILTLSLSVPPRRIGIFLDYSAGTLLFLNVTNHGFLIYKFSSCSFSQKTFPYFNPLTCKVPINLCSPSS
ncbi:E3 ubiquitin-protein ligase TRIM34-like isoform X1 [Dama dama]|uniref:E3 ubiquitin-protein ligase TRIM34-like isoform X1 n=1 Tax=Dama dama TaxID=30532 RepID=UPI002A3684D8|nr:E3 ubiquitin-protein ligase TRIM34-like isoform X1 [Dama dama]XP_061004603.1 E3 ubiquitin-protein ligase TRIM34-like isoform X1 [Dama dama]